VTLLESAIKRYGVNNQVHKAVEELTELSLELQRFLEGRGDEEHIREEVADVTVMLAQLELMFGSTSCWAAAKLNRLMATVNDGDGVIGA